MRAVKKGLLLIPLAAVSTLTAVTASADLMIEPIEIGDVIKQVPVKNWIALLLINALIIYAIVKVIIMIVRIIKKRKK